MDIINLDIPDVKILRPMQHKDNRGFFSETFNHPQLKEAGLDFEVIQENYSFSKRNKTIRGLHYQMPPFGQAKLIQVLSGAILDIAVDIRRGSPWFGQHISAEMSADTWQLIYIPEGFAHGFCTLQPDTTVVYKVTAPYSPEHDTGISWCDPELGIAWPANEDAAMLSEKDQGLPRLADTDIPFSYQGAD